MASPPKSIGVWPQTVLGARHNLLWPVCLLWLAFVNTAGANPEFEKREWKWTLILHYPILNFMCWVTFPLTLFYVEISEMCFHSELKKKNDAGRVKYTWKANIFEAEQLFLFRRKRAWHLQCYSCRYEYAKKFMIMVLKKVAINEII